MDSHPFIIRTKSLIAFKMPKKSYILNNIPRGYKILLAVFAYLMKGGWDNDLYFDSAYKFYLFKIL